MPMITVLASFFFVIALLFGVLYLIRYIQKKNIFVKYLGFTNSLIEVVSRFHLDQKNQIILIRYQDEGYLILLNAQAPLLLKGPFSLNQDQKEF